MQINALNDQLAVSGQIVPSDLADIRAAGYGVVINNRPDGESADQPSAETMRAACEAAGLAFHHLPVQPGRFDDALLAEFRTIVDTAAAPVLAYCRTGNRSATCWALSMAPVLGSDKVANVLRDAGMLSDNLAQTLAPAPSSAAAKDVDVLIVGGGAGGISVAASLRKRRRDLRIAIVEPRTEHYYQPGFTLVGGGVFRQADTVRAMGPLIPRSVEWLRDAVYSFDLAGNAVITASGQRVGYRYLVLSPGIKLDWSAIDGLEESLGRNGVTSNYRFDLAPYTWQQVQNLREGRAVFTQPPMPIKCAGAPQKAMYLSCDAWRRAGVLGDIQVDFYNAGAALFGVADYVPALERYVQSYGAHLHFQHNLTAVDCAARKATFRNVETGEMHVQPFDLLHVCPPQTAPDFVRESELVDAAGWIDVDQASLRHRRFANVFALGDAISAPNAKTAAAVRKQAPVVAENLCRVIAGNASLVAYDGYGSCPLTVERGKVVLAEFGYGGRLQPTVPKWVNDGTRATRAGWLLKAKLLPPIYYDLMLKGREWLAAPANH